MIKTSRITGVSYDPSVVLYITDIPQWAYYFQNGCDTEVVDIVYDPDYNPKRPLCIVFKRSKKMQELYQGWLNQKKEGTCE